jgi:hypothetical protein
MNKQRRPDLHARLIPEHADAEQKWHCPDSRHGENPVSSEIAEAQRHENSNSDTRRIERPEEVSHPGPESACPGKSERDDTDQE